MRAAVVVGGDPIPEPQATHNQGVSVLAASYPFLDVLWSMVIFFMFFIWIMILFKVFADLFRRRDIDGGLKVAWFAFVIVLPFLGVFVYLISQGHKMADRDVEHMQVARA